MCILLIQSEKAVEQQTAAEEAITSGDSEGPHSDQEECAKLDECEEIEAEGENGTEYEDEIGTTTETEMEPEKEIENSNR